jgi:thiosulfate dehydrogenase [quinone] large subunit
MDDGIMNEPKLSPIQWGMLITLRILVGWHFLYEGVAKLLKGNWSAVGYLLESKWILSGWFHWMASHPNVLSAVDFLNMWGLTAIGLALIAGFCTRPAGMAGILLILLYYVCNPPMPGLFYSIPMEGNYLIVNKNLVELGALAVLVVIPTERIVGIDRIVRKAIRKLKKG